MKTIKIFITLMMLFTSTICYAGHTRPLAPAIEWWLRTQDKFVGASVCTKMEGDEYVIGSWDANGVAKPDYAEMETILDDYDQYLIDQEAEKVDAKNKTKTKLGMTDKQLEELKRALEII